MINRFNKILNITSKFFDSYTVKEKWYTLFFSIFAVAKSLGLISTDRAYLVLGILGIITGVIAFSKSTYTTFEYFVVFCLLSISGISFYYCHKVGVILLFFACICLKGVNVDKVIKVAGVLWTGGMITKYLLSILGIIPSQTRVDIKPFLGEHSRYDFSYSEPNLAYLTFAVSVLYLAQSEIIYTKKQYIIVYIIASVLFFRTYSLTGIVIITITVIAFGLGIVKYWVDQNKSKICFVICGIPIVFTVILVILYPYIQNNDYFIIINKLFAGRLKYNFEILMTYPVHAFGQELIGLCEYEMIDNMYVFMIIQYGIVVSLVFTVGYFFTIRRAIQQKQYNRLICIMVFLIYAFMEQFPQNPFMNFTILFVGEYVWELLREKQKRIGPKVKMQKT